MNLRQLEAQIVLQEQHALDLTLTSDDRLRPADLRLAWDDARALEAQIRRHGSDARELLGRLSSVMVDLMCADERIRNFPQGAAAA